VFKAGKTLRVLYDLFNSVLKRLETTPVRVFPARTARVVTKVIAGDAVGD
jgi:hypothetical protein